MKIPNGITFAFLFLLLLLGLKSGCVFEPEEVANNNSFPTLPNGEDAAAQQANRSNPNQGLPPSTIIIGSFNIQVFGVTKAANPRVMEKLVDIARRFDLLAIQELKADDPSVIEHFIRSINSDGSQFSYEVGPRQGYTISKEQYVYIFDTAKLKIQGKPYVASDPTGTLHRPPWVASFQCVQADPGAGFSFTLLNLHVDPDVVDSELQSLEQIMPNVMRQHPGEDDFIVMGDFNESANHFRDYHWVQNQFPVIRSNWSTKVRSGRSIDNIVIDGVRTSEYRNQSGVLNFMQQYGITRDEALEISDHYPVWALFSTVETKDRVANNDDMSLMTR